jgi:hypothetical protein
MRAIRHIILSVAALFAATDISFAQTYSLVPNDSISITGMFEDLQTLSVQQVNISSGTIQLKWKKVSESVPALWDALVCDNALCNTSLVDSGTMNPVVPGDYGFLLLHVTPHVNYGVAIIRYAVWDIANAAMKDTLTFILSVNNTSGIGRPEYKNGFSVFPNPSKERIHIVTDFKTGFEYLITDVSGKEIKTGVSTAKSIFVSTENFSDGVYNVLVVEENKILISKKIIIQHGK